MKVSALRPEPTVTEPFRRDRLRYVPAASGCYVLTTLGGEILYAGLTVNLRSRMDQHLETPAKVAPTAQGRAMCFHWLQTADIEAVERGWLNAHRISTGCLPILNKMDSPVSC